MNMNFFNRKGLGSLLLGLGATALLGSTAGYGQTLIEMSTDFEGLKLVDGASDSNAFYLSQAKSNGLTSGDLNGDGHPDLVIGAGGRVETIAPSITKDGQVFVRFGPMANCGTSDLSRPW